MSKVSSLQPGSILSESSFFTVKGIGKDNIEVVDDFGNALEISKPYAEKILVAASYFSREEKKTMTELAELFISSPRIAMEVCFITKATEKTKKDWEAEKAAKIAEIQSASLATAPKLLNELLEKPISRTIPGRLRVMRGRHHGHVDELGRVHFIDMEQPRTASAGGGDSRSRQVDPRTIQYIIKEEVKYSLK